MLSVVPSLHESGGGRPVMPRRSFAERVKDTWRHLRYEDRPDVNVLSDKELLESLQSTERRGAVEDLGSGVTVGGGLSVAIFNVMTSSEPDPKIMFTSLGVAVLGVVYTSLFGFNTNHEVIYLQGEVNRRVNDESERQLNIAKGMAVMNVLGAVSEVRPPILDE